jgi:hypothetical protein
VLLLVYDESSDRQADLCLWTPTDSPRIYVSTNPWKITATFQSVSSTREDYVATIEKLKEAKPAPPKGRTKLPKLHTAHVSLIESLESRLEAIDIELVVSKSQLSSRHSVFLPDGKCRNRYGLNAVLIVHITADTKTKAKN